MPIWPLTLPQEPRLDTVEISGPTGAVLRTAMDAGPKKQRKRVTAAPRPMQMTFGELTDAQVIEFERWFEEDIGMGSLSFTMNHPFTGDVGIFRFADPDSPYQIQMTGQKTTDISVQLELLP